jgi:hypothetical protein
LPSAPLLPLGAACELAACELAAGLVVLDDPLFPPCEPQATIVSAIAAARPVPRIDLMLFLIFSLPPLNCCISGVLPVILFRFGK